MSNSNNTTTTILLSTTINSPRIFISIPYNAKLNQQSYTILYPVNSIVYVINDANKGVLTRVAIRTYNVVIDEFTFGQPLIVYTDSFNRIWNQEDLCPKTDAVNLALAYYNNLS